MATVEAYVRPANSLLLLLDSSTTDLPGAMGERLIAASSSCVAVGTKSEADGPTRVQISDEGVRNSQPDLLAFEGRVQIPSGRLAVESVQGERYLELAWREPEAIVKIWLNHRFEPDEILVLVQSAT